MKITDIKANPDNPRVIKDIQFKKLCNSITEFPKMMELRPIVIDENNMILGGNMRFRALEFLKMKDIPDAWVKKASELTEDEKKRFIIADNVSGGEWDWDLLANEWDAIDLENWGVDIPTEWRVNPNEFGTGFSLADGDKAPFQQMTFTLADEQAEQIKNAISDIKQPEEYKYAETMGNENSNGNALYLIIMQWAEQRK